MVPLWTAIWLGGVAPPGWLPPAWWHGHEMLFGTVAAAIAGFLLTASPVWSGRAPLVGRGLLGLAALWGAGRIVMLAPDRFPTGLVAAVDLAFLPVLAGVLARTLWGREQRRNHGIVLIVAALAVANGAMHAEALGLAEGIAQRTLRAAVDAVVVLIVVIGGRITPAFTANALRRAGVEASIAARPWLDRAAVAGAVAVVLANAIAPASAAAGVLGCAAGIAVAARLAGWQTRHVGADPLVWSLHAGMAWVAAGLVAVGVSSLGVPVLGPAGLHALTAGGMGAMILAVMTRVALGHTGRPFVAPRGAVLAYALVHGGAAARIAAALVPALHRPLLILAALLWAGAFAVFAAVYAPILLGPRADGKPG